MEPTFDDGFLFANFSGENANNVDAANKVPSLTSQDSCYIKELEEQNLKLKTVIKRLVGPQLFQVDVAEKSEGQSKSVNLLDRLEEEIKSKPFAVVLYLNNDLSNVHRKDIDEVLQNISQKTSTQDVLMSSKLKAQNSAVPLKSFTSNLKGKRTNPTKSKDVVEQYVVCACQYYKGFMIDRMGTPLSDDQSKVTEIWNVPAYQQLFFKALPIMEEVLNVRVKQLKQCFNCGGEHHLMDCDQPKDRDRINNNRMSFTKSKSHMFNTPKLVFEDADEKFKNFEPGKISTALEEALGISLKTELPPYIYKMRQLGYPTAWLYPTNEGLKIYINEGIVDNGDAEEGEIEPVRISDIIRYPGFNAPVPEGVKDQSASLNFPQFNPPSDSDIILKSEFAEETVEPARKKRKSDKESGICDMEIAMEPCMVVDGNPPLPLIEITCSAPPLPSEASLGEDVHKLKIDSSTYRNWYNDKPLHSIGVTYVNSTPPPSCVQEVFLRDIPKYFVADINRESSRSTLNTSWFDPLYGNISDATGTFDTIKTLLMTKKHSKTKQ